MNRRNFIRETALTSIVLVVGMRTRTLFGEVSNTKLPYDLVAIRGGEPDAMFDSGIKALGGMKNFVWKGARVLVKPNIGWDVSPERGGNTNPKLVSRIIKHCLEAGAKQVVVVDHPCDEWQRCYTHSGIEKAVKDAGGKIVPGGSASYYHNVAVKNGRALASTQEHEAILESDVFINVPILKDHSSTGVTIGMKNLMGNVWDREYWHRTDVHQCIADFATYRRPTLNVLDAYYVMKQNGPRGISTDDLVVMKSQVISTDIVALDAAGAKLFGISPDEVRYLKIAAEMKIGRADLENLNIKRIVM